MALTWPENSDLEKEFFRTWAFLEAAVTLHQAALTPKSESRTQKLHELVKGYYRQSYLQVLAHSDSRVALHKELVTRAGGPKKSALTRNFRYAWKLRRILWPSDQDPPFGVSGVLDDKDLERVLKSLDDNNVLAGLRPLSIPDLAREREEMETEACTVDHWRREMELAAERGGAKALIDRTRQIEVSGPRDYWGYMQVCDKFGLTRTQLKCLLDRNPTIRTKRPLTKKGKPHPKQREIHVADLLQAMKAEGLLDDRLKRQIQDRMQQLKILKQLSDSAKKILGIRR